MNRLSLPLSLVGAISGVGALILYFHAIPAPRGSPGISRGQRLPEMPS